MVASRCSLCNYKANTLGINLIKPRFMHVLDGSESNFRKSSPYGCVISRDIPHYSALDSIKQVMGRLYVRECIEEKCVSDL